MKKSFVDVLAERVSKEAGCTVTVHRLVDPNKDRLGRPKVGMYQIEVSRGGHSMRFGDMRVAHAKQTLAMIADMVAMGFIRSHPTEDAYMAACRSGHWRAEQLRAHGIEPIDLSKVENLTHYPPEDFDWSKAEHADALRRLS